MRRKRKKITKKWHVRLLNGVKSLFNTVKSHVTHLGCWEGLGLFVLGGGVFMGCLSLSVAVGLPMLYVGVKNMLHK